MNTSLITLKEAELTFNQYQSNDNIHCLKSKIALIISGNYHVCRGGKSLHLKKGDVFVSSAGDYILNPVTDNQMVEVLVLDISNNLIEKVMNKLTEHDYSIFEALCTSSSPSFFELVNDSLISDRIISLSKLKEQQNAYTKLTAELYLQEIVTKLIQQKTVNLLSNTQQDLTQQSKIAKATKYLKNNYSNNLSIDELAKVACMSRASFYTRFKEVTGLTPNRFLNNERIHHSKILLKFSDKPIKQIGLEVGFFTAHHFINRFKIIVGETPGIYRKRLANSTPHL